MQRKGEGWEKLMHENPGELAAAWRDGGEGCRTVSSWGLGHQWAFVGHHLLHPTQDLGYSAALNASGIWWHRASPGAFLELSQMLLVCVRACMYCIFMYVQCNTCSGTCMLWAYVGFLLTKLQDLSYRSTVEPVELQGQQWQTGVDIGN